MRNNMVMIPSNFPRGSEIEKCPCGQTENMKHIYSCKLWTTEIVTDKPKYENIFSANVSKQVKVNKYFVINYKTREKYQLEKKNQNKEQNPHEILNCDPLSSLRIVMDNK